MIFFFLLHSGKGDQGEKNNSGKDFSWFVLLWEEPRNTDDLRNTNIDTQFILGTCLSALLDLSEALCSFAFKNVFLRMWSWDLGMRYYGSSCAAEWACVWICQQRHGGWAAGMGWCKKPYLYKLVLTVLWNTRKKCGVKHKKETLRSLLLQQIFVLFQNLPVASCNLHVWNRNWFKCYNLCSIAERSSSKNIFPVLLICASRVHACMM